VLLLALLVLLFADCSCSISFFVFLFLPRILFSLIARALVQAHAAECEVYLDFSLAQRDFVVDEGVQGQDRSHLSAVKQMLVSA
jgi:hypothetical protein